MKIKQRVIWCGALMNMGVYAIQSAIYGSGMNPISVRAQEFRTRPNYFKDTDETITAQFEFPNGAIGNIFTFQNVHVNKIIRPLSMVGSLWIPHIIMAHLQEKLQMARRYHSNILDIRPCRWLIALCTLRKEQRM